MALLVAGGDEGLLAGGETLVGADCSDRLGGDLELIENTVKLILKRMEGHRKVAKLQNPINELQRLIEHKMLNLHVPDSCKFENRTGFQSEIALKIDRLFIGFGPKCKNVKRR